VTGRTGGKGWFVIMMKMRERRFLGERLIEGEIGVHMLPGRCLRIGRGLIGLNG